MGSGALSRLPLPRRGLDLACVARTSSALAESAAASEALGRRALTVDVTDHDSVEQAVARTVEVLGRLDILVNNAGGIFWRPAEKVNPTELARADRGRSDRSVSLRAVSRTAHDRSGCGADHQHRLHLRRAGDSGLCGLRLGKGGRSRAHALARL